MNLLTAIKGELAGWRPLETAWLALAVTAIAMCAVCGGDNAVGVISAVSGAACVVLTCKGKLSAYAFGVVNCALYAWISAGQALWGEVMLNAAYYLPMQAYGFVAWKGRMTAPDATVEKRAMGWPERVFCAFGLGLATALYGIALEWMNDPMPYIDAFTTAASVFAMWLSVKRFAEQWWIWIAVDVLSVWMWFCRWSANGENAATLAMWCVFLANAVWGAARWELAARKGE